MIPKTEVQKRVNKLRKSFPPLSSKQKKWAINLFDKFIFVRKNNVTCFECGNTWDIKCRKILHTCPKCHKKLKHWEEKTISGNLTRQYVDYWYISIFTIVREFQVIRYFYVNKYCKVFNPAGFHFEEIYQHWINPKGQRVLVSKLRRPFSSYSSDPWWRGSKMDIRHHFSDIHFIKDVPYYPKMKIMKEVVRNGFYGDFFKIHPSNFFTWILKDSRAETLLKSNQIGILNEYERYSKYVRTFWQQIKICIRNHYVVCDASIWFDHLGLLLYFGYDIHNAKYICPKNLKREHQKLIDRRQKIKDQQQLKELNEQIEKANEQYQKDKYNFFNLKFTKGKVNVIVLKHVRDFFIEGKVLHHCVYTNAYYDKKNTLIMSARKGDKILETIDFSLSQMQIMQCRGACNKNTRYHNIIVKLVNDNKDQILKAKRSRKKFKEVV